MFEANTGELKDVGGWTGKVWWLEFEYIDLVADGGELFQLHV